MNRREAIASLVTLPFAPLLGRFDHSQNHGSPRILVACSGASGRRVYDNLNQLNTSDLLLPMIVDTEAEMQSVAKSISDQRVVLVAQLDAMFDDPLTWKMLRIAKKQRNCCFNFSAFIVYPYLTAEEITMHIPHGRTPRWAYSEVGYVRVVNAADPDKNKVQSRWQLRFFNRDLIKVEKQVANEIMKVQIQGNWR